MKQTIRITALAAALLAGSVVWSQPAMAAGDGDASAQHGAHHRMGHGAGRGMGSEMGGGMQMAERALDSVGASAEQKARVREIFKSAKTDLQGQRESGQALRQKMLALWAAPQPDAAGAEVLRQQQMAQHDTVSRRMMQAMLDAQAVLTPDQRHKLAAMMKARSELGQRHHLERRALDAPRS